MADYPCAICGKPIGYDEPFVIDPPVDYLTHIACDEKAAEAAAKNA